MMPGVCNGRPAAALGLLRRLTPGGSRRGATVPFDWRSCL